MSVIKITKKHFIIIIRFLFIFDSKSSLHALQSTDRTDPLILQLLEHYNLLSIDLAKTIRFYFVPSHVGIRVRARRTKLPKMLSTMMLHLYLYLTQAEEDT